MSEPRAKVLFVQALELPAAERNQFLLEQCGDDAALRHEVQSLLAFHEEDSLHEWKADAQAASRTFKAGDIFAERYRMVSRIGRGGMGDVWRVDDLSLHTQVALKLMFPLSGQSRASVLNEVRLARQLTDPAICRVFDVGESAGGQLFFTMELVEGEDLAALLKRVGRVPAEKVIDIGRQLCGGIATAHAHGVLHRDLKPANVLIDGSGRVRITDFGIAIAIARGSTAPQMFIGTPGYMAPEQMTPGMPLTAKTDLYALGLLLYELASGQRPFDRPDTGGQPPSLSSLQPDISPALDAVVRSALAKNPADRPASAVEISESLARVATGRSRAQAPRSAPGAVFRGRRLALAVGALALAVVVFFASRTFLETPAPALNDRDTIVVADFENNTDEAVFDGTLQLALAVTLEQSPFLKVFPGERVRESLRLMQRSPDERLTRTLARDVARREQAKALLAGSIGSLGSHYVIALEAVNAETGDSMAREQVEADSREGVLTALGTAATRLREKLGESLASLERFDVPLPRATTPSLEALHAYALALPEGRMAATLDAIPSLKRAIELDPEFALAYASLSGVLSNTDQPGQAPEYARRAFELRDRVSERERFVIGWRYYRDATFDAAKQLELTRTWTATYPRESAAFNSLGLAHNIVGQYEQALEAYRESMRLDPKFFAPYGNIAEALLALNRLDEAREMLRQGEALGFRGPAMRRVGYLVAFATGDEAEMRRQIERAASAPESNASSWLARSHAFAGEIELAHESFRRAIVVARERGLNESAAQLMAEDGEAHALVRQCEVAGQETAAALGLSHDAFTLQRSVRTRALCGDRQGMQVLIAELTRRYPEATLAHRAMVPVARAALLLRDGDPDRAIEVLEEARPYDRTQHVELWSWYERGVAYLALKDGKRAAEQFQQVIDHRGVRATSPLYPLSSLGLARAAMLNGDQQAAVAMYDRFLTMWQHAPADLAVVADARKERVQIAVPARVLP